MTIIGTDTFRIPVFLTEGTGINLTQDGVNQALSISIDDDALADILGGAVITTDYQESVRAVATTPITLYGPLTVDGVELVAGDRALVTAQVIGANNRIWVVQETDWTIAEGWDVGDTITSGTVVPIEEGTTNATKIAVLGTANPITLGTTSLTWAISDSSDVFISNFIGRNVSGATFTLTTAYAKGWIFATRAGNQTFTIPTNATQPHDIGTEIVIQQDAGSGTKTIQAVSASVVLNGSAGGSITLTTRADAYLLKKKSTNTWTATPMKTGGTGDLLAANNLSDVASASTARTNLGLAIGTNVQAYDADTLKADTAANLTAGFTATAYNAGTQSTGTFTPDPDNGNFQRAVNGGAHTLAPPSASPGDSLSMTVQYTNDGSAGAITTSGFTLVDGDSLTTTNGDDFMLFITVCNGFSLLTVKALQ